MGAVEGTEAFSSLLNDVPESILDQEAKQSIDPLQRVTMASDSYIFPWQSGTSMQYGGLGVHANGFTGVVSGW
ncbi:MAG TPA: hypothetical protein PLZ51_07475, partial [Aggregatilineales bacterium]|nr:hypothetical protein [Aggregatilineales bacterium]